MKRFEFWPDNGGALLWTDRGERVSLDDLSLSRELVERAGRWVAGYDDSKLPWEPTPDAEWLAEGRALFVDLRRELLEVGVELTSDEDFWAPRDGAEAVDPDATGEA